MSELPLSAPLSDYVDFRNGKSSPDRSDRGVIPLYGANGTIGTGDTANVQGPAFVIGRVGSYCGSLHFVPGPAWVTDNALIATASRLDECRYWFYALQTARLN